MHITGYIYYLEEKVTQSAVYSCGLNLFRALAITLDVGCIVTCMYFGEIRPYANRPPSLRECILLSMIENSDQRQL